MEQYNAFRGSSTGEAINLQWASATRTAAAISKVVATCLSGETGVMVMDP